MPSRPQRQSEGVMAMLWLPPHERAEELGHLCSVIWKLPGKQPPD